jgi:hypothetical protein
MDDKATFRHYFWAAVLLLAIFGVVYGLASNSSIQNREQNTSNREQNTSDCEQLKSQVRTQSQVVSSLVSELMRAQDAATSAFYSPALNKQYFAISSTYANAVRKVYTSVLIYPECFTASQIAQFTIEEDKWWRAVNSAEENWANAINVGPNSNYEAKDPQVFSRIYPKG